MNEIWCVTIEDGANTVEQIFLDPDIRKENIVNWMLWRMYHQNEWEETFLEAPEPGETVAIIDHEDGSVAIYHHNMIPDITIEKVSLTEPGPFGKHGMKINRRAAKKEGFGV